MKYATVILLFLLAGCAQYTTIRTSEGYAAIRITRHQVDTLYVAPVIDLLPETFMFEEITPE